MVSRRGLVVQLGLVGAGFAAAWTLREKLWSPPTASFSGSEKGSGWLEIVAPGAAILIVEARLNSLPVRTLIDTGAERSVVHAPVADRLGLAVEAGLPMAAVGLGGSVQLGGRVRMDLQLGDLLLTGLNATKLDLGPLAQAGPFAADLVIGRDVLKAMAIDLELPNRRLALSVSAQARQGLAAGFGSAPLMVEANLEGRPLRALVDSGASGHLALSHRQATTSGLLKRPARADQSMVLGGTVRTRSILVSRLEVAGRAFEDVEVHVLPDQNIPGAPDAIVGLECFRRDRVALDLGAGRLTRGPIGHTREKLDVLVAPRISPR